MAHPQRLLHRGRQMASWWPESAASDAALVEQLPLRHVAAQFSPRTRAGSTGSPRRATTGDVERIKVMIADDHPLIIEGLTTALARHDIEVVAQAATAEQVLDNYIQHKPDVLVLDVRFREGSTGLDVARLVLERHPDARIVYYTQFDQDEVIREAYRSGGVGFVTKDKAPSVLADAIKSVHGGKTHFLSEIAERLALMNLRRDDSPQAKLEPRELEVFARMAQGQTNAEIAEALGLSLKTISMTSQTIKDKLGVHRPADITRLAVKHKLIEP